MNENISISICVPAYNEAENITKAVEDLFTCLSPMIQEMEVIIVDDGSNDTTAELSEQLARKYFQVKVIHHKKNSGIGACYRNALAEAKGEYFTWFPGDHENSAQEFVQCLPYIKSDTVVTSHHLGYDRRSFMRRFISRSYTWILNRYFNLDIKYYNGLTIFPVTVLRSFPLYSNGFALFAENLIRAIKKGYKVKELSTPLRMRMSGESKAFSYSSISRMVKDILVIISNGAIIFR